jgi:hypothetical protein
MISRTAMAEAIGRLSLIVLSFVLIQMKEPKEKSRLEKKWLKTSPLH